MYTNSLDPAKAEHQILFVVLKTQAGEGKNYTVLKSLVAKG